MNAAELKALARNLNHAAWMAGSFDDDYSWKKSDLFAEKRDEALKALLDAIDVALPTLPAAGTITLGSLETDESVSLSFTEVHLG